jgi:uncharacterized protein (DUF169 family)
MESKIAKALKMELNPIAIIWSNKKPEHAQEFKEGKWACSMWMFANAAKGKSAVFSRKTFGCWGNGVGVGFGNKYLEFPGGIDCFYNFLSSGNKSSEEGMKKVESLKPYVSESMYDDLVEGERYIKSPENVKKFIEQMPIIDIDAEYVIFKPLKDVNLDEEKPVVIIFPVLPNQLSALVVLANYGRETFNNVIIPWGAGCQTIGIFAYKERESKPQRAVIGLTDISARNNIKKQLGENYFTFAIPYEMFLEMEDNVEGSFLERNSFKELIEK